MDPIHNVLFGLPEVSEQILNYCDLPSQGNMRQICKQMNVIIENSLFNSLKNLCLGSTLWNTYNKIISTSNKEEDFVLSRFKLEHPATTETKKLVELLEILWKGSHEDFREISTDTLCDLPEKILNELNVQNLPENISFHQIIEKAKKREKGIISILSAEVVGPGHPDDYSRRHSYSCIQNDWQVSFKCHIYITCKKICSFCFCQNMNYGSLPVELFLGKKTNDFIKLNLDDRELKLVLSCAFCPIEFEDKFEDVASRLISEGRTWPPSEQHQPSEEEQKVMLLEMKSRYDASFRQLAESTDY